MDEFIVRFERHMATLKATAAQAYIVLRFCLRGKAFRAVEHEQLTDDPSRNLQTLEDVLRARFGRTVLETFQVLASSDMNSKSFAPGVSTVACPHAFLFEPRVTDIIVE